MAFPDTQLDLATELFIRDRWVEVTDDVRVGNEVRIQHGSASQDRTVPPARCTLTLDNSSDKYNRRNPLSPNYGVLGRNTPLRVSRADLAADTCAGRTVSNGWGTSSHGEAWSQFFNGTGSAADFAVSGGAGKHTIGTANGFRVSYLAGVVHRDVDVAVTLTLSDGDITGADIEPCNIVVRGTSTTDYVMVRLVITTAEAVTIKIMHATGTSYSSTVTVPGLTHSAAQKLRVRVQAEGTAVRAKVWPVSSTVAKSTGEPLGWHVEGNVTGVPVKGWVGVRSGVASGNTDVPVVFSYSDFTVRSNRFAGEISSWPPEWDLAEVDRRMPVDAAGIMRRLGQGASPLRSTLRRSIPSLPNLVAYWPMEDERGATSLASALPDAPPMSISGDQSLASYSGFDASQPLPTLRAALWRGPVQPYTATNQVQVRWVMHTPETSLPDNTVICRIWTSGTIAYWDLATTGTGGLRLLAYTSAGLVLNNGMGFNIPNRNLRVSVQLSQNGANVDYQVSTLEVGASFASYISGTLAGQTTSAVRQIDFSLGSNLNGTALGHCTVETAVTDLFALNSQLSAFNGETATDRIVRLCAEEGVPVAINGEKDDDARMGPQLSATLLDLLSECADVDLGILGESRGTLALKYRTRLSMCNQSATAAIDYAAMQLAPPFKPTDDDRYTLNDITARRAGGTSYRTVQNTGPMSVLDPPNGAGRYDSAIDVNCAYDWQLPNIAGWLLALGTVDEYRIPTIAIDLAGPHVSTNTTLVAGALSLDLGDRITVDNLSSVGIYDQISQLVPGYTETLGPFDHKIEANAVPSSPYRVLVADDPVYGLIDSGSSTLTSGISAAAMSFQVSTADAGDLWTTDPADFPLEIKIGGERIRISSISGSSSPQTFTVATSGRGLNLAGNTKAHAAGAEVHVADPVNFA
ncbi:hypothetical protein [Lentzea sp. NPDC059081]|uniref:hypothetical protein n=1 Tax=Lentzea sp. NPDC059081 TaxID=3346719 RepID=UPI003673A84E